MTSIQTDVVVIGGGLAGHTAALQAAASGAEVILIEKQEKVGGSTVLSGGSFAFAGTDMQQERGIEDSNELLAKDLTNVGGGYNDPALVQLYADKQLEAYQWLRERDVTFGPIQISSGQSVPRLHPSRPDEVIRNLNAKAEARSNIRVVTNTAARALIREDGAVVGVNVTGPDGASEIRARSGVVLASGGFPRSEDMIETFVPNQRRAKRVGGPGNVGDGLKMAWLLGAGFRDMGYVKGTFGNHPDATPEQHTGTLAVYKGAIAVNKEGHRFANESISYKTLGDACLAQTDGVTFQIFDQGVMAQSEPEVPIFNFQTRLEEGLLLSAPTLRELAGKIGVPPDQLEATVRQYNEYVDAGHDPDFGRKGLSLGFGKLHKFEEPPFYAYPSTSTIVATYCGLTVDTAMRVLQIDGTPINRLYAAGELVGGFHGEAYMTGTSLGKCVICGRIAGEMATGAS